VRELSLHILDVLENSIEAGASRVVLSIEEDPVRDTLVIEVTDNGRGMSGERAERVLDPFYTTRETRHVGLGLPLFAAAARRCDGDLTLHSAPGEGSRVRGAFRRSHIDRAPLGDMPSVLLAALLSEHLVDLDYVHKVDGREFRFDSSEIRRDLGEVPLTHPKVRAWLVEFLEDGEESLTTERPKQGIQLE
jgi:hypothetical protein